MAGAPRDENDNDRQGWRGMASRPTLVRSVCVTVGAVLLAFWGMRTTPSALATTLPENPGDPAFTLWTLDWVWSALISEPSRVFDAPLFAPRPLGLTWSDPLLGVAPIYGVFRTVGAGRVLAWNLTEIALIASAIVGTYGLTRRITGRTDAGIVAGSLLGVSGFVVVHHAHLQLLTFGWFALAWWGLLAAWDSHRVAPAVGSGIALGALATSALYFTVIIPLFVVATAATWMVLHARSAARDGNRGIRSLLPPAPWWRATTIASVVFVVPTALVAAQYLRGQDLPGVTTRARITDTNFRPVDLLTPKPNGTFTSWMNSAGATTLRWERTMSFGVIGLVLAVIGLVVAVRLSRTRSDVDAPKPDDGAHTTEVLTAPGPIEGASSGLSEVVSQPIQRRALAAVLVSGVVCGVVSLGPEVAGISAPLSWLDAVVPGFDAIRVPSRLAAPLLIAVAVLAGLGSTVVIDVIRQRAPHRTRLAPAVTTAALACVSMVELSAPARRITLDNSDRSTAVYEELANRASGVVVELPFVNPLEDGTAWAFVEAPRMVLARIDDYPRVNGYSGGFPDDYPVTAVALSNLELAAANDRLTELGVRYVLVHVGRRNAMTLYDEATAERIARALGSATRFGDSWLVTRP
jgi:hypothetical protein